MATKKSDATATTASTTTTTVNFSDSEVIAVVLKDSIVYPRDGVADVTEEQLEQLKAMGSVE